MPAANSSPNSAYIALLRGINVGGHNKIPMADLRKLCAKLGFSDVQTYIQSGNVIFTAHKNACAVEALLESTILKHFSLAISVIVRNASIWPDYVAGNPSPEIANDSPGLLIRCLSKLSPKLDAVAALRQLPQVANASSASAIRSGLIARMDSGNQNYRPHFWIALSAHR